ncbi:MULTISPECIES: phage/plasmid primase, P4 family [unclassified Ruegeria]|uniref:phage/plasmid primase, P4 family n=1 Tax=unclassified Ruegeria TaxID=2625375 RepID=UPI0014895304|nr:MULTISPECIES: phage/plasmid primase, P4 family [unclassified Ruegeria]
MTAVMPLSQQPEPAGNHVLARRLAGAGLPVFPCLEEDRGTKKAKAPYTSRGFKDATTDVATIDQWWQLHPGAVVGLPTGKISGLSVIDGDIDKETGEAIGEDQIEQLSLSHPGAVKVRTQSGGVQFIFNHVDGVPTSSKKAASHVDTRGDGGYIIAPGSNMTSGAAYTYEGRNLSAALEAQDLPDFPIDAYRDAVLAKAATTQGQTSPAPKFAVIDGGHTQATDAETLEATRALLAAAPNTLGREDWVKLAVSLRVGFGDALRDDFVGFSMKYVDGDCSAGDATRVWNSSNKPHSITSIAPALALLKQAVGDAENKGIWRRILGNRPLEKSGGQTYPDATKSLDLSHDTLAIALGESGWNEDARYVAAWNKWLFWTGTHWAIDDRLQHMTLTRKFLRQRAEELIEQAESNGQRKRAEKQADIIRGKTTVAAVADFARSNPASAASPDNFDEARMLLGTPGGTVDLSTGEMRAARRDNMITKQTAVAPAPDGTEPSLWLQFLRDVFDGDTEVISFIQRAAGYALTGITSEHKMLFLYGTGRNGKPVFLNTLFDLFGDYARRAPASIFLNSRFEQHSTGIAGLQGARLVVGSELPKGKSWDEATIKDLTGGDKLTARLMKQDYLDFDPQLTLFIAGNNMPSFAGIDEAIRARVVLVPFTVTIPPEKRDKTLPDKLRSEAPAILRWAIDGALQWQQRGLDVPDCITAASNAYFHDEDILGQFLEDETDVDTGSFVTNSALHQRFGQWCEQQGLQPWTQRTLQKEMKSRQFVSTRRNTGRGFLHLKLKFG